MGRGLSHLIVNTNMESRPQIPQGQQQGRYGRALRPSIRFVLFATAIVLASLAITSHHHKSSLAQARAAAIELPARHDLGLDNVPDPLSDSMPGPRRLLPYSVISGGVQNASELRHAVLNDAVVARHYEDFNLARAHVISLDRDRAVYVSYRMGSEIFWTNRRLELHKGETLITDGTHEARTRCGNRISENLLSPTSAKQPGLETLERFPVAGPFEVADLPLDSALTPFVAPRPLFRSGLPTGAEGGNQLFATGFAPFVPSPGLGSIFAPTVQSGTGSPGGSGSPSGPDSPTSPGSPSVPGSPSGPGSPPLATPEPSTLLLLSGALLSLLIARKFQKPNSSRI